MIKTISGKHVMLSMVNGTVLEGFVYQMDDNYLKLIENDNKSAIVKIEDISFARVGGINKEVFNEPQYGSKDTENNKYDSNNDYFSMEHPKVDDFSMECPKIDNHGTGVYRNPSLVRKTDK